MTNETTFRPEWLRGRQTHSEMLPAIKAENEAWRVKHLPALKAATQAAIERREALKAAIWRIENEADQKLIREAVL